MEPPKAKLWEALKLEHPGLSDEVIAEYEDLLSRRFLLAPTTEAAQIAALDRRRRELVQTYMPRYDIVAKRIRSQ